MAAEMNKSKMQCPHCGSSDFWRLRRKLRDRILSFFNRWPYICHGCRRRFWANARWPTAPAPTVPQSSPRPAAAPSATIEVRAHSQEQLNQMLLTLNQAISQFQQAPRSAGEKGGDNKHNSADLVPLIEPLRKT